MPHEHLAELVHHLVHQTADIAFSCRWRSSTPAAAAFGRFFGVRRCLLCVDPRLPLPPAVRAERSVLLAAAVAFPLVVIPPLADHLAVSPGEDVEESRRT